MSAQVVRFGPFEVDLRVAELRLNGKKTNLPEQPFQILIALLEKQGDVVTREELRLRLWGADTFVDFEHGLNSAVSRLREELGDCAESPRFIETVPRRGYRLIVPVENASEGIPAERSAATAVASSVVMMTTSSRRWRLWLLVGVVLAMAVATGLVWRQRRIARQPAVHIESLAVLPLENLSGNPDEEYFADGMTEALITELGKVHALRVISRQSVLQYQGTTKPVPQIARELNVDALVEGSALHTGGKVRVTAQLIQAKPERHLWSESYERSSTDLIPLQHEIAEAITREIRVNLAPNDLAHLTRAHPSNPGSEPVINAEAQEAYCGAASCRGSEQGKVS